MERSGRMRMEDLISPKIRLSDKDLLMWFGLFRRRSFDNL
jgi:hypothetical protein